MRLSSDLSCSNINMKYNIINAGTILPRECSDIADVKTGVYDIYPDGNENIHKISSHGRHALRVEMSDFDNQVKYAEYVTFSIGDERDGYSGDAGDSLTDHSGMKFSTFDRDNDMLIGKCAVLHGGAWWYNNCYNSNLNGYYLHGRINYSVSGDKSVVWRSWRGDNYGLKSTKIMIRKY
ncbi:Microfibril-associated glycoprotein 4 [Mytilus edulis]|uniref:Microfibril-associated glycoprotein 4 n=1 Tax=Mytilus edulis TaxID=6550 RepID=A0A8S3TJJ5_MYTED|nr:Microfibril-associated glycoprotein 4 [Mytilus edulis]